MDEMSENQFNDIQIHRTGSTEHRKTVRTDWDDVTDWWAHDIAWEYLSLVSLALLVAVVVVVVASAADATTYSTVFVVLLSAGADSQRRCCN